MSLVNKFSVLAFLIFLTRAIAADSFEGFTYPYPVYSAAAFGESVFLAAAGGVRQIETSGKEILFTSEDGLETTEIYALAADSNAIYAVSAAGTVARYNAKSSKFQVINRSVLSENRTLVPDLARIQRNVLVLGFVNRLSFFDLKTERFLLSIERIGNDRLELANPKAIEIKKDSLFVSLGQTVYARKMNWDSLAFDNRLADPESWTEYYRSADSVLSMTFQGNTFKPRSAAGTYRFDANGKETSACEGDCPVFFQGKQMNDAVLFREGKSLIRWIVNAGDGSFFVGSRDVLLYRKNEFRSFTAGSYFPLKSVHGALAFPSGGVLAYDNRNWVWSEELWQNNISYNFTPFESMENITQLLKTAAVDSADYVLMGNWGGGFFLFADRGKTLVKWIDPFGTNCIETYLDGYIVPRGVTTAPDGSGFLVSFWGKNNYGFAYIDRFGEVSCALGVGTHPFAGPVTAQMNTETGEWTLYVSSGFSQSIEGNGALDVFTFPSPVRTGGSLEDVKKETYPSVGNAYIIDMDLDRDSVLWVVTQRALGYFEKGMTAVQAPHQIKTYGGASHSSIKADKQNRLWVSSVDQGIYLIEKEKQSPDSLKARNFQSRDGLLSNQVYGLALDSKKGDLWVVQDKGLTRYSRNDLRDASSFMTGDAERPVLVYPNPFKPREHMRVVFDYLSEEADVLIYNRGGSLVRAFRNHEVLGGRAEWDGRDASARLVAPGVYHYFVKKGSKKEKGKLLIIH
ncbi:MAG: hypothetical protein LBR60_05475 [Fibrobacter sp.]|jgi:hypothetical protein|nr:hypothetical protein [Fibrobacter sp.]